MTGEEIEEIQAMIDKAITKHDEKMYRLLDENPNAPVLWGKLRNYFRMAATTPAAGTIHQYPRMMYKRANLLGNEDLNRIVQDATEEAAATQEGWVRTPTPAPPGFPKVMVEAAMRGDYRRVAIRNVQEQTLFQQVTNPADWIGDAHNAFGGRPVTVNDLASEHRARLHQALDEELRNPTTSDTGEAK